MGRDISFIFPEHLLITLQCSVFFRSKINATNIHYEQNPEVFSEDRGRIVDLPSSLVLR